MKSHPVRGNLLWVGIRARLSLLGRGHDYDLLTWTTVAESTTAGYIGASLLPGQGEPSSSPASYSAYGFSQSWKLPVSVLRFERPLRGWSLSAFRLLSAGRVARLIDSDLNARLIIRDRAARPALLLFPSLLVFGVNGCPRPIDRETN